MRKVTVEVTMTVVMCMDDGAELSDIMAELEATTNSDEVDIQDSIIEDYHVVDSR